MSHKYTPDQLKWVEQNRTLERLELVRQFNEIFGLAQTASQLSSLCKRKKWHSGRTGRFAPGHIPSPKARPKGPNSTSFKKGSKPYNWLPVGSERINTEGYRDVKIAEPNVWKQKHRINWEAVHSELKPSITLRFIDGDKLNCEVSNLAAAPRDVHLHLNRRGFETLPAVLKPTALTLMRLECKIFSRRKEQA